jgi:hypothetical protein
MDRAGPAAIDVLPYDPAWPREAAGPAVYTQAKTDIIQELTDLARAGHGLPPMPVWQK